MPFFEMFWEAMYKHTHYKYVWILGVKLQLFGGIITRDIDLRAS